MHVLEAIYSLKSAENMRLYHSVKERFDYKMTDRENFISETAKKVLYVIKQYDHIFIPESSSDFILNIVKQTRKNFTIVSKKSITEIENSIPTLNLQKKEKESVLNRITEMNGVFKINKLKSNQRRKFEDLLFNEVEPRENSIILDDSLFSGVTLRAMSKATRCQTALCVFSKEN